MLSHSYQVNVMGWYANYVFPVGAFLVGILAGSGYGLASWFTGRRASIRLLSVIAVLQLTAYWVAVYLEYRRFLGENGLSASSGAFWTYFDITTRSIAFESRGGRVGSPLGLWGYGIRCLEIVGFVGGGLAAPAYLRTLKYCESCARYMRQTTLGLLPLAAPRPRSKEATALVEFQENDEKVRTDGLERLERLRTAAESDDTSDLKTIITDYRANRKSYEKLTSRARFSLYRCPSCASGLLQAKLLTGHGKKEASTDLWTVPVTPDFTQRACPNL